MQDLQPEAGRASWRVHIGPMDQESLIARIVVELHADTDLRALFLAGSLGRGNADRYSDVDLVAVVEVEAQAIFVTRWRSLLNEITPVVFWHRPRGIKSLVSAVMEDWLRCDLFMVTSSGLHGRAKSTMAPLIDQDDLYATLPDDLPPGAADPKRVQDLIEEFLRILGLVPVVMGRGEHVVAARGAGMLRDLLIELMLEDAALPGGHGALHLNRLLPPEDMAVLAALPPAHADRPDIDAQIMIARAFIPRARRMADDLGVEWPKSFAGATARHVEAELGVRLDLGQGRPTSIPDKSLKRS